MTSTSKTEATQAESADDSSTGDTETPASEAQSEIGGRKGPDPTRYGDWEKNGRCIDF